MLMLNGSRTASTFSVLLTDFCNPDWSPSGAPLAEPLHATDCPTHAPEPTDTVEKTAVFFQGLLPDHFVTQTPSWAPLAMSEYAHSVGIVYSTLLTLHRVRFCTYVGTPRMFFLPSNLPSESTVPIAQLCAIATDVAPQLMGPP